MFDSELGLLIAGCLICLTTITDNAGLSVDFCLGVDPVFQN